MISINEQKEIFTRVNNEMHEKTKKLFEQLKAAGVEFVAKSTSDAQKEGFAPHFAYYIGSGTVEVDYDEKQLFLFEEGDFLFPHCVEEYEEAEIFYEVNSEVEIFAAKMEDIFNALGQNAELVSLYIEVNKLTSLQMTQILGSLVPTEERANPGFQRFVAGDVIIQQGDEAEYVYSITSGLAVAVHDGVEVGEIKQDEIFGAIAVLTDQPRTASVVAKKDCMVLMVHRDEFSKMVHSHPTLFLSILKDLSKAIKSLNSKVTELSPE